MRKLRNLISNEKTTMCIKAFSSNVVYMTHLGKEDFSTHTISTVLLLAKKKYYTNSQSHNWRGAVRMCQKVSETFDSISQGTFFMFGELYHMQHMCNKNF